MSSCHRALITGASGLLGRAVLKEFNQSDVWEALGLAYTRAEGNLRRVDLTDAEQVACVIDDFKPTVIIHCAAERRPDRVEKEEAATKALNVTATATLCRLAAKKHIIVLYISTDYVFDGKKPPFLVTDKPTPLNKYGKSKRKGEMVTMETSAANMVLRVPALYGPVEFVEESSVTLLFKHLLAATADAPCAIPHYERRFPTDVRDVAAVLLQLLDKRVESSRLTGIFHWSAEEEMTKYDVAVVMAQVFGLSTSHISGDMRPCAGAPRPFDTHLDSSRIEKLGICVRTPFNVGIESCLREFL